MADITVFKRYEKKYRVSGRQKAAILDEVTKHMALVGKYSESDISSIYLDTPEFSVISHSLDKPLYKEKLRIRLYNFEQLDVVTRALATKSVPDGDDALVQVFVELKKKYDGIVYKRRVAMTIGAAVEMLFSSKPFEDACRAHPLPSQSDEGWVPDYIDNQIAAEIMAAVRRQSLISSDDMIHAAVATLCEREAYTHEEMTGDRNHDELRVTFDSKLRYIDLSGDGADAESPSDNAVDLLNDGEAIMEIKSCGVYPDWLTRLLDAVKAYPSSFSKCGHASLREHNRNMYDALQPKNTCSPTQHTAGAEGTEN